jgi:hypothetical protein
MREAVTNPVLQTSAMPQEIDHLIFPMLNNVWSKLIQRDDEDNGCTH